MSRVAVRPCTSSISDTSMNFAGFHPEQAFLGRSPDVSCFPGRLHHLPYSTSAKHPRTKQLVQEKDNANRCEHLQRVCPRPMPLTLMRRVYVPTRTSRVIVAAQWPGPSHLPAAVTRSHALPHSYFPASQHRHAASHRAPSRSAMPSRFRGWVTPRPRTPTTAASVLVRGLKRAALSLQDTVRPQALHWKAGAVGPSLAVLRVPAWQLPGGPLALPSVVAAAARNVNTLDGDAAPVATSVGSLPSSARGTHRGQGRSRVSSRADSQRSQRQRKANVRSRRRRLRAGEGHGRHAYHEASLGVKHGWSYSPSAQADETPFGFPCFPNTCYPQATPKPPQVPVPTAWEWA